MTEAIDTTTSGGTLVFHLFGALAECEREVIRERNRAGRAAARARGRMGGRPRAMRDTQLAMATAMLAARDTPVHAVCDARRVTATSPRTSARLPVTRRPMRRRDGRAVRRGA